MSDEHFSGPARGDAAPRGRESGLRVTRRTALIGGGAAFAAAAGVAELDPDLALAAAPISPGTFATVALPTTTAPEQVRLAWGSDPAGKVTISWSAPGTAAMPAPTLAWSAQPIGPGNAGTLVTLPAATPLDPTTLRTAPCATSFTDGLSGQTTYHYHVPLEGLAADTRYYYEISDGASTPSTLSGSFQTAPSGRPAYRFTAFGDIGTPYTGNPSGCYWKESSDTSIFTVDGILNPGDGQGPGLFHLMLADLSYGNANPANVPSIWRDYQVNTSRATAQQPWMPIMGNHEVELGANGLTGTGSGYYNGPYGCGSYQARHVLPDNGLTNWDGNKLQGHFYSFQVGTVLFVCLNTNDVVWQNPQMTTTGFTGTAFQSGTTIPAGTAGIGQYESTGGFAAETASTQLVPDTASGTPNLQTQWLEQQLRAARTPGSSVDIIVVCEHHCALSSGPNNGCDMAIRAAWMPLYDEYEVDLVIGGHDHDYERSYPVRGFDADNPGTATAAFTNPFASYASGAPVNTRRPTVVTKTPDVLADGSSAWDTAAGTVYLGLGGAGAIGGPHPNPDPETGLSLANVWATNQGIGAKQCATEDATWSANYDTSDNYGYAVFDVDPGNGPGETTLTYQWYQVPTVPNGGTVAMPTMPYEEFIFRRLMPAGTVTVAGGSAGTAQIGDTLTVTAAGWPVGASYAYQWLRAGSAIPGATDDSYTTVAADGGQQLTVEVTVTAQSYPPTSVGSAAVAVAAAGGTTTTTTTTTGTSTTTSQTPTPAPQLKLAGATVSGSPQVGQTVTALVATSTSGAHLAYQWLRDGQPIAGATSSTYRPSAADVGQQLSVTITETAAGLTPVAITSPAVKVTGKAFSKTTKPTIHGVASVGHTVSVRIAGWAPSAHFTYQWLLGGHPIHGATHKSLKLTRAFAGKRLSVRVTGSRPGFTSHPVTSAHVVVHKHAPRASRPRISGTAQVGETLQAHTGDWSPGTEFSYRWYAGGQMIPGATGHALRVSPELQGKRIVLAVSGRAAGRHVTTLVSLPTRAVRRVTFRI